jgi:hypothetical protein
VAAVALVSLGDDDGLQLSFPKRNPFRVGDALTVHLDDRVGSEIFTIELRVHRSSYKGKVTAVQGLQASVALVDFDLYYGSRVVARGRADGYTHPEENRPPRALVTSALEKVVSFDDEEKANKLGVLITRAPGRPHTTVMAFLNSDTDDIFLITMSETYKFQNLLREPDCVFALDHRGNFHFERQVDWNYTLYEATARRVDPSRPVYRAIQAEFVAKNPWEAEFFSRPSAVMLHLEPRRIIFQDVLCD